MIEKETWKGGARLDLFNVIWPFATLSETKENLEFSSF